MCYGVAVGGKCWLICTRTDCTDGVLALVGIIPSMVQEGTVIVICIRKSRRGCYEYSTIGRLGEKELIVFAFGLVGKLLDRTSSGASGNARMAFICRCVAWRVNGCLSS